MACGSGSVLCLRQATSVNMFSPSVDVLNSLGGCGTTTTQVMPFSSGNPRIEETRGVMRLFRDGTTSSSNVLPVRRKPLACVLGVPSHMTYADFYHFCGSFISNILEMRIVRNEGTHGYSVLITFDTQDSADNFYKHLNGKTFSSLEADVCFVQFVVDVQHTETGMTGQQQQPPTAEPSACPLCLEKLEQESSGILTTICNHSFHCNCISKWTDSSCPVCRYCYEQPEKSTCFVCQTSQNLWMCVICGFLGCGRDVEGHAVMHWNDTEHCYSLELETQRVWDYAGDNYVHRLIQSKTDGKLVELNAHSGGEACGICPLNTKIQAIIDEYNDLLTSQLENQRLYFEGLLSRSSEELKMEKDEAIEKATTLKSGKMHALLDKCRQEKKFLDDINENLLKNQGAWEVKMKEMEEREKNVFEEKDGEIERLEARLVHLMSLIDCSVFDSCGDTSPVKPIVKSSRVHGRRSR